ncbi:MAG: hypothetical protein H6621_06415 [Halobacteriovoraceae bacterium]|nr:hypothetical protein [Halobacteriovoraceae bacterium]
MKSFLLAFALLSSLSTLAGDYIGCDIAYKFTDVNTGEVLFSEDTKATHAELLIDRSKKEYEKKYTAEYNLTEDIILGITIIGEKDPEIVIDIDGEEDGVSLNFDFETEGKTYAYIYLERILIDGKLLELDMECMD